MLVVTDGGHYSQYFQLLNGSLSGMVAICAGCDRYYPWAAAVVSGSCIFSNNNKL